MSTVSPCIYITLWEAIVTVMSLWVVWYSISVLCRGGDVDYISVFSALVKV